MPRRTAYDLLAAVQQREAYANLLLPRLLTERGIAGRDAALATELAYGTLRGLGTYDAVLAACSDRPLDKLDPPVLHVLRLGAHQLLATRVGSHAAVATSVDLAKSVVGPRVSGYANAVLRRVATRDLGQWLAIVAPAPDADPDGHLAIRHSYPRWIVAAYRDALGEAAGSELADALAAGNARPRVTMAAFPGGVPRAGVMPGDAEPGRWSPYAFTLAGGDPSRLVTAGQAAVQDEASQLAAIALSRVPAGGPDRMWLDMCAGPGGKTRMLYGLADAKIRSDAEICLDVGGRADAEGRAYPDGEGRAGAAGGDDAGARLVAADARPHRAGLVRAALDAAPGAGQAEVVVADGRRAPWRQGAFDRVLVDVPCSGLGALRRRPEARWRKSEADLAELGELQRSLLRAAIAAARPGGVIGYVTCSPVPAETADVVRAVLSDPVLGDTVPGTGGAEILDAPAALPEVPGLRSPAPGFAQFWPHRHGTDAIFIALLRRR